MTTLQPYLFFVGTCREAMTHYQGVLGGDLVVITAAEMPDAPPDVPEDMVMHASLSVGDALLLASDDPSGDATGPKTGFSVSVDLPDVAEANRVFAALADGGQVNLPMGETSWSPAFGMLVDRFGIPWMVSTAPAA